MAGVEDSTALENQNVLPASKHSNSLGLYDILASTSLPTLKSFLFCSMSVAQKG